MTTKTHDKQTHGHNRRPNQHDCLRQSELLLIYFKKGTITAKLTPELLRGLVAFTTLAVGFGITEIWVTSVNEGKHRVNSAHYFGKAVDLRSHDWPDPITEGLTAAFRSRNPGYQLLWESRGTENAHLHLEFQGA